jgi:hypothetical protein
MKLITIILLLASLQSFGQAAGTRYTLSGTAVHNGTSQGYRLDVVDDGTGKIKGQNISIVENGRKIIGDVIGSINYSKKRIYFKETRVTNLRPGETQNDYCFFEVNASYIIKDGRTVISGKFVGHSPNGTLCGNGDIYLLGPKSVEAIHNTYVQQQDEKRKASLPPPPKKFIPPPPKKIKKVDTALTVTLKPKIDTLSQKEKNIFPSVDLGISMYEYDANDLQLAISDYDKEDADRINLYINNRLILKDYTLSNRIDTIALNMMEFGNGSGTDTISVVANNEGYYSPNSARVVVLDDELQYTFFACNNYKEKKYLILRRRK